MRLRDGAQIVYSSPCQICENDVDEDGNRPLENLSDDKAFHLNVKLSTVNCLSELSNGNNNGDTPNPLRQRLFSETNSVSSRDDSLADYEGQSSSSVDIFFKGDEYQCFSQEDATDSDFSEDGNDANGNPEEVNQLTNNTHQKEFYDKPKFDKDFQTEDVFPEINYVISSNNHKFEFSPKETYEDSSRVHADNEEFSFLVKTLVLPVCSTSEKTILPEEDSDESPTGDNHHHQHHQHHHQLQQVVVMKSVKELKDGVNEKKYNGLLRAKPEFSPSISLSSDVSVNPTKWITPKKTEETHRRQNAGKLRTTAINRRSLPLADKKSLDIHSFDIDNIETSMPKIDLDAIESHLKAAAKEAERRRKNDREEIRRRLAMGTDSEDYGWERMGRKPSLQSRLQGGMNLQICFMNDTGSDSESAAPEVTTASSAPNKRPVSLPIKVEDLENIQRRPSPSKLTLPLIKRELPILRTEADLFAFQTRLQAEARAALMQAKDIARLQMQLERQKMVISPITQMVRKSLAKVGVPFPEDRRRFSRQLLTEMNVAQLQVIVNDLHTQIEILNEELVKYLMNRDDLHMEQDSMLVDIEDLTRYLGAKEKLLESSVNYNKNRTHHLPAQKSA